MAVAVEDIDAALELLDKVLGITPDHRETIEGYGVETATLKLGNTAIELVAGTTPDSPISKYIEKRGPGIHHIALEVDDIHGLVGRLVDAGVRMIDAQPRPGAHGTTVAFVHPKSTGGVLVELVQAP